MVEFGSRSSAQGHTTQLVLLYVASILVVFAGVGYAVYDANRLTVNHINVKEENLNRALVGKVVMHITDLHMKGMGDREREALRVIESQKPDFVFLTGDYVQWNGDYYAAIDFLSCVMAKQGAYAVMGDYDYSNSRKSCLFCHEQGSSRPSKRHSVKFLRNSCEEITIGAHSTVICGIDGRQADEPLSLDVVRHLRGVKKGGAVIVLSHSPLAFDLFNQDDDVLILSGDTHGGQIPLPKWFWEMLGYEKMKYEQGWFEKGKKKMYVSRGVGTSHFPIRFLRPPEITVFHFQSTENEVH